MSEETDAPQGGAEGAVAPEAVETLAEQTTAQDTGTEEAGQADETGDPPKRVPWWEKRFGELTAEKYAEQRQRERVEAENAELRRQLKPPQPEATALPTLEQFDYDEAKYQAALTDAIEKRTERVLDTKLTQRERVAAEERKNETAIAKLKEGGAKHPDFVTAVSGIPATEAVRDFILAEKDAADVLYELGKDTAASERFNSLSPYQQAIELGRRAATPKATSRTIPPPPPTTVAGLASGLTKPMEEMSYSEFVAAREAEEKTRN